MLLLHKMLVEDNLEAAHSQGEGELIRLKTVLLGFVDSHNILGRCMVKSPNTRKAFWAKLIPINKRPVQY
jgi:hypothetical protein